MKLFNRTVLLIVSLAPALCSISTYGMDIFQAARTGNIAKVQELIAAGTNLDQQDNVDWTPLHWAALFGHLAVVQILIAAGANVNQPERNGWTPSQSAALRGRQAIVVLLADYDQRIHEARKRAANSAFTIAQATHPHIGNHGAGQNASPLALVDPFVLCDIAHLIAQAEDHDARQPRQDKSRCIIC